MNPFSTEEMAKGYARSRPPVHPWVIARMGLKASVVLDIGCGAGVSTAALAGVADVSIGIEPAESMLRWARETAPTAQFIVGTAEAILLQMAPWTSSPRQVP